MCSHPKTHLLWLLYPVREERLIFWKVYTTTSTIKSLGTQDQVVIWIRMRRLQEQCPWVNLSYETLVLKYSASKTMESTGPIATKMPTQIADATSLNGVELRMDPISKLRAGVCSLWSGMRIPYPYVSFILDIQKAMSYVKVELGSFYRAAIPKDITAGTPSPSLWGVPSATLSNTKCNISSYFSNHAIIFGTLFVG